MPNRSYPVLVRAVVPPIGLSREAAAQYLGIGTTMFDALVNDGRMPKPRRVNRRRIWDRAEIESAFRSLPLDEKEARNPWDAI